MNRILGISLLLCTACNCSGASTAGVTAELSITCQTATDDQTIQCDRIDFGNVEVGGSAERQVHVVNNGRAKLLVSSTDWSPATDDFSATALPAALSPRLDTSFKIVFAPHAPGSSVGDYVIASNAKGKPSVQIHCTGNGVAEPRASVTPATVDFGNVAVGQTEMRAITVHNDDTVPLIVSNATISMGGGLFGVEVPTDYAIPPGETRDLTATYTPTEAGNNTGEATIRVLRVDNPSATPTAFTVVLAGHSLPIIQVDPTAIMFGDRSQGSRTQATVTITNIGVAPLILQTVTLSVGTSATYSLATPTPQQVTIQPQNSVVATVVYQPVHTENTAADTGTLVIASSDPQTPVVNVPITAQCTDCNGPPPNTCSMSRTCNCGVQSTCAAGGGCIPARRVFVSKQMTTGNLGGTAGADQLCNQYATEAVLGGTWKAFLADSSSTPATRFVTASVPYALLDGTLVANDWAGLVSGSLLHGISLDECAGGIINAEVWTGLSSPSASSGSNSCNNFTSTSGSYAQVGISTRTGYDWYNVYVQFCDRSNVRLYCVEQ